MTKIAKAEQELLYANSALTIANTHTQVLRAMNRVSRARKTLKRLNDAEYGYLLMAK